MAPADLRSAGEALYGARWQSELARDLGVSDRTMRRWLAGASDLPDGAAADLLRLCEGRVVDLRATIDRLRRAAA